MTVLSRKMDEMRGRGKDDYLWELAKGSGGIHNGSQNQKGWRNT